MRYLTYDTATGALTGAYIQDLRAEHAACHIEVDEAVYDDWHAYRMNAAGDGLEVAPVVADLSADRAAQWEAIKVERDGERTEGGVLVGANWFHTDTGSRIKWLGLKDSARDRLMAGALATEIIVVDGDPVAWKTMGGAFVPVTVQLALDVVEATKVLDKKLFVRAEQHHALMLASTDPAAYDHSTGWPASFTPA